MELPKRKRIRLEGYDYSSCGAYFVTICVKDRHKLLSKIIVRDDAHIVPNIKLSETGLVVQKYINEMVGVDKYVIMPNHIHLIIRIMDTENGTMWASSLQGNQYHKGLNRLKYWSQNKSVIQSGNGHTTTTSSQITGKSKNMAIQG